MKNFRILIVDDEPDMRESLRDLLSRDGYHIEEASDGEEALDLYRQNSFDIVISDIIMQNMDGIELLKQLKKVDPEAVVILITGYSSIQGAISAIKMGAEDYFTKPFKAIEIKKIIQRIYDNKYLSIRNEQLMQEIMRKEFPEIIGESQAVKKMLSEIRTVADSDVSVLVTGESGTGKELAARAIHQSSPRKNKPFVPINCAAVPNDLLESEFFGHEKGAFSGAINRKYGIFEVADTGTLFLDEIGEMPFSLQAKLLRTVETKLLRRIGGTDEISVDIRIVCSTNRDLKKEIEDGKFREDLYFRLSTYNIHIDPLRNRKDDIPLLIDNFLQRKRLSSITFPETMINALQKYDWPGNVRELENVLERILLFSRNQQPTIDNLPPEFRTNLPEITAATNDYSPARANPARSLEDIEKEHIQLVYYNCNGNKVKTARTLEIGLKTLYRKLEKYNIKEPD
ncbi:MAG: sigma-54-dependent Fis family transcriptional regulator [Candidatus Cloacimonetes bacterium]|nr:sigma-54-dependent Fis family transcriptional regulator [Candidatus Cloacimonadota bacterium]